MMENKDICISIHALLAESDLAGPSGPAFLYNFYPRSPCGERPGSFRGITSSRTISIHALLAESDILHTAHLMELLISIHALLAESDGGLKAIIFFIIHFYPRSPCGERHSSVNTADQEARFLSTLSLRRATNRRSNYIKRQKISIHALLAESD